MSIIKQEIINRLAENIMTPFEGRWFVEGRGPKDVQRV